MSLMRLSILLALLVLPASPVSRAQTVETPAEENDTPAAEADASPDLAPRGRYNRALELFHGGDWAGASAEFLQARDEAGPDPELRYRAAFNLGMSLASQADTFREESPEEAIELLRQSSAWFNDAIRLGSESDEDARVNLELILRRIQQLADQLNQGNKLEARLDRVIDDQRGLRDGIRRLLQTVEAEGVAADPLGYQQEFDDLATRERVLQAETGSIVDLAAEERALVEGKPEEERSDEERSRRIQLQNLEHYLFRARQSVSDSRRRLRGLEGERAHRRADAGLAELKRAREQLLDPITVLKSVTQDEMALADHTRLLELLRGGELRLGDDRPATPPPWLTVEHLEERQQTISLRTGEVLARLEAGIGATDPEAPPEQQRLLAAAGEAVPYLEQATSAMAGALAALAAGQLDRAAEDETRAIQALLQAIERFAGVRELIELAYDDQTGVVRLVTPPEASADPGSPLAALSTDERMRLVREAVDNNRERLQRLEGLLEDEQEQAEAQATQEDASADLDAIRQRYELAGQLREQAASHLRELAQGLTVLEAGKSGGNPLGPARETLADLEELRRLFFSLVEHLKDLLREQTETHDSSATMQFEADAEGLQVALGPAAQRQQEHAATAAPLAQAVDRQADAAASSTEEQAQQAAQALTEAAGEVHAAASRMDDASFLLGEAVEYAEMSSPDLEPVLEHQLEAMEHLENAIRLLQPPQQQQEQDQQQQQQQQEPQAQPQPQEDEMSQRQAQRRLQAIRDREAERQRERREESSPEPVEKDW